MRLIASIVAVIVVALPSLTSANEPRVFGGTDGARGALRSQEGGVTVFRPRALPAPRVESTPPVQQAAPQVVVIGPGVPYPAVGSGLSTLDDNDIFPPGAAPILDGPPAYIPPFGRGPISTGTVGAGLMGGR